MTEYTLPTIYLIFSLFVFDHFDCSPTREPFPHGLNDRPDPFSNAAGLGPIHRNMKHKFQRIKPNYNQDNEWGFEEDETRAVRSETPKSASSVSSLQSKSTDTNTPEQSEDTLTAEQAEDLRTAILNAQYGITTTDLPPDPRHNGLLKDIGSVGVGFGVGVGVKDQDPVSVATGVSVGLDGSGPAGGLPQFLETIFPRPGEQQSLNDYDGNKDLIVSGKASKYIQAARLGFIKIPQYAPVKSLVGVNSGIGVLGAQAPSTG